MASKRWFMYLFLYIGVPMIIIGLLLLGASVYMIRRKFIADRKLVPKTEFYTHIDLDDQIYVNPNYIKIMKNRDKTNINDRIKNAKKTIIKSKQLLENLADEQMKFNKLIHEKNIIDTYIIKYGKIVYSKDVIENYPKLHKYLIKLHNLQNTIRFNWDELDSLVINKYRERTLQINKSIYVRIEHLIKNSYELQNNKQSQIEFYKKNPNVDKHLSEKKKLTNKDLFKYDHLKDIDTQNMLNAEETRLLTNKSRLEKELLNLRTIGEILETRTLTF